MQAERNFGEAATNKINVRAPLGDRRFGGSLDWSDTLYPSRSRRLMSRCLVTDADALIQESVPKLIVVHGTAVERRSDSAQSTVREILDAATNRRRADRGNNPGIGLSACVTGSSANSPDSPTLRAERLCHRLLGDEQRLLTDLARHTKAACEMIAMQVSAIDDKYAELPGRVSRLEATVFPPRLR